MSSITLAPDASGTAIFTVAAPATSTNQTLTLPDATTTLVGTDATQTLTNKSIASSQLTGALPAIDGSALTGLPEIGVGQTWQNLTGSRSASTSYQNLTGRPIMVAIYTNNNTSPTQVSTDNSTWVTIGGSGGSVLGTVTVIVPNNHYYRINGGGTITSWAELR